MYIITKTLWLFSGIAHPATEKTRLFKQNQDCKNQARHMSIVPVKLYVATASIHIPTNDISKQR